MEIGTFTSKNLFHKKDASVTNLKNYLLIHYVTYFFS